MNRIKNKKPVYRSDEKLYLSKKIEYPNTTFAPIKAKNDTLIVNNRESVIICVFMTHIITLFYFCTSEIKNRQFFYNSVCKISVIYAYVIYIFFLSRASGTSLLFAIHKSDFENSNFKIQSRRYKK